MNTSNLDTVRQAVKESFGSTIVRTATIGGSGSASMRFPEELPFFKPEMLVKKILGIITPHGTIPQIKILRVNDKPVVRVPVHGWERLGKDGVYATVERSIAVFWLLHSLGVEQVIIDASAGGIRAKPWDIVIPDDIYLYEDAKIKVAQYCHSLGLTPWIRMADPFCPRLRAVLYDVYSNKLPAEYRSILGEIHNGGNYWTTPLSVFETPLEIQYLFDNGADLVGQSSGPEAFLGRVSGICVSVANPISNFAEGLDGGVWNDQGMKNFYNKCSMPVGIATWVALKVIVDQERTCSCHEYGQGEGLSMLSNDLP
jgi:purine nucleoside phosphorylase